MIEVVAIVHEGYSRGPVIEGLSAVEHRVYGCVTEGEAISWVKGHDLGAPDVWLFTLRPGDPVMFRLSQVERFLIREAE